MVATVAGIHLSGNHAGRPAANTVPDGSLYSCSTHGLIYQSNYGGNSWSTWATLGSSASGSITSSGYTQSTARLLGRTTASTGAIEEISVGSGLTLAGGSLSASGSSGSTFGQENPPPTSFSGNDDPMSATTNWTDVNAPGVKEILDSTVLHLQDSGASQDGRVRYTLGTTRAGAFDFRFYGVLLSAQQWGADFDSYLEIYLTTSGGTGMAMCRLGVHNSPIQGMRKIRFGQSGVVTTNTENPFPGQMGLDIKFVRDGSNNVTFFWRSIGSPGWHKVLKQSDNRPYSVSSSGTIARVELAIIGPSGPSAGDHVQDVYIDTFKDAS